MDVQSEWMYLSAVSRDPSIIQGQTISPFRLYRPQVGIRGIEEALRRTPKGSNIFWPKWPAAKASMG